MNHHVECLDGNEAAARIAYAVSEVISIYPITPASPMAEHCDDWSAAGRPNLWGKVPDVVEMQSEAGAAGALHGALQKGALATTFTASQGLLLMIPNMFKIAGELTPAVIHVAARTIATHALSIFGDHSDVMHARTTGWAMLAAGSVQEAHDFALIAHAATLRARIPFLHFFDGFRTSHEINKIAVLDEADVRALVRDDDVLAFRTRGLTPDAPVVRGTAQNPDVFFQAREASNPYHLAVPGIVQEVMDELATRTGRRYGLVDYHGASDADRVIIVMGSASGAVEETVDTLVAAGREGRDAPHPPLPAVPGRADRRRAAAHACDPSRSSTGPRNPARSASPSISRSSPRSPRRWTRDDPPFDTSPRVIGGRYGLSSKEMTPSMIKPIFEELAAPRPKRHFTVGIYDDVTHLSLPIDTAFQVPRPAGEVQAVFFGLGSDGTVGANKASVKIIGESTDLFAQGYFVYDSKKSGSITVSHLRFGPQPIRSTYLVEGADFVACHQFGMLGRTKVLESAKHGATFLLNAPYGPDEVWDHLPGDVQRMLVDKEIDFWVIDALAVAAEAGMGSRINTVMQPCFFKLAGILPPEEAIAQIKAFVQKTYAKRGEAVVARNFAAIDRSLERLGHVTLGDVTDGPADDHAGRRRRPRLRRPGHLANDGRRGRPAARQRPAGGRHLPHGHGEVREAGDRPDDPDLGSVDLHRLRQVRDGLPARDDPDEGLPDRPRSRRRRSTSSTRSSGRESSRSTDSRSRSRPTIAPAAACASTCVPPRARPTRATRRSTWSPSPITAMSSGNAGTSSSRSRASIAMRCRTTRSRARRSSSHCSSSRGPAAAAARRRTSASSPSSSATG